MERVSAALTALPRATALLHDCRLPAVVASSPTSDLLLLLVMLALGELATQMVLLELLRRLRCLTHGD
jgi:hypothetical protein